MTSQRGFVCAVFQIRVCCSLPTIPPFCRCPAMSWSWHDDALTAPPPEMPDWLRALYELPPPLPPPPPSQTGLGKCLVLVLGGAALCVGAAALWEWINRKPPPPSYRRSTHYTSTRGVSASNGYQRRAVPVAPARSDQAFRGFPRAAHQPSVSQTADQTPTVHGLREIGYPRVDSSDIRNDSDSRPDWAAQAASRARAAQRLDQWRQAQSAAEYCAPYEEAEEERKAPVPKPVKQDTIDLHGLTKHRAIDELRDRFRDCQKRSISILHVIVGRGHNSENGPVLKPAIRQWLEQQRPRCTVRSHPSNKGRLICIIHY